MNHNTKKLAAIVAVIVAIFLYVNWFSPLSVISIGSSYIGTDPNTGQNVWIISLRSTSYSEEIRVFNQNESIDDKHIVKERVSISFDYDPPYAESQFSVSNRVPLQCFDASTLQWKSIGITLYPYANPDNPKIHQTAKVKIFLSGKQVFSKNISLTDGPITFQENGISLVPEYQAYQYNPTLIHKGTMIASFDDGRAYWLDQDDWNTIRAVHYPRTKIGVCFAGICMLSFDAAIDVCPFGGPSEKYRNVAKDIIDKTTTAPPQSLGGILTYTPGVMKFNRNTGVLTLESSYAVSQVFTLRIPKQVGDVIVWDIKSLQPEVVSISLSPEKVGQYATATARICNRNSVSGYVDIYASVAPGGAVISPSTSRLYFKGAECQEAVFYLSKRADNSPITVKVRATSDVYTSEKSVQTITTPRDAPNVTSYSPIVQNATLQTAPVIKAECLPLVQKEKTVYPTPILGWFGLGETQISCVWNYEGIGIAIAALGFAMFLLGDFKRRKQISSLGIKFMILGALLFAGTVLFESTVLHFLGGNGILVILLLVMFLLLYSGKPLQAGGRGNENQ